ncbi:unnamed protein product, partial [Laminaria digitata]
MHERFLGDPDLSGFNKWVLMVPKAKPFCFSYCNMHHENRSVASSQVTAAAAAAAASHVFSRRRANSLGTFHIRMRLAYTTSPMRNWSQQSQQIFPGKRTLNP